MITRRSLAVGAEISLCSGVVNRRLVGALAVPGSVFNTYCRVFAVAGAYTVAVSSYFPIIQVKTERLRIKTTDCRHVLLPLSVLHP